MWEEAAFTSEGLWKELTCYGVCWKSFHVQIRTQPLNRTDSGRGVWKVSGEWIGKGEEQLPHLITLVTGLFLLRVRNSLYNQALNNKQFQ